MKILMAVGTVSSITVLLCSTLYHLCLSLWHAPPRFVREILPSKADSPSKRRRPMRINKPIREVRDTYDVVVIGSGYGAGVAACRLSRAEPKQSVCVLERGLERWPGKYPTGTFSALRELRISGHLSFGGFRTITVNLGKASGLYNWICTEKGNAFVADGLGGTSLVNADVYLRPDPRVLQSDQWPVDLRQPGALDQCFERAEAMLEPRSYPKDLPEIRKYRLLRQQAEQINPRAKCFQIPQTVAFQDFTNAAGVAMRASTLTGQDALGLNDGSKNTVLATYLADAWCHGAELFCGCNVQYIKKHPKEGFLIYFFDVPLRRSYWPFGRAMSQRRWVQAKRLVFLGAGSLGSTEIVLRSKQRGLPVRSRVGKGLSGNGGFLGFSFDLNERVNSVGQNLPKGNPPGPTISGSIECEDEEEVEGSFLIQDGSFPTPMETLFRSTKLVLARRMPLIDSLWHRLRQFYRLCSPLTSAIHRTQVYLVLGHDNANGTIALQDNLLVLDLRNIERSYLTRIKATLVSMTFAFGGIFMEQSTKVVVHPLDGLNMASNGTGSSGATDSCGRLFSTDGSAIYPGICVVDGSVISRSLGVNPVATITAVAERSVDLMAKELRVHLDCQSKAQFKERWKAHVKKVDTHLAFSEKMVGHLAIGGKRSQLVLLAEISVRRISGGFNGVLTGTLKCQALAPGPLVIRDGTFETFAADPSQPDQMAMRYTFKAISHDGSEYGFRRAKFFNPSVTLAPLKLWRAATTLFVTVEQADGPLRGTGVLVIDMVGFIALLGSLTAGARTVEAGRQHVLDFIVFFAAKLAKPFFAPLMPLQYPPDHATISQFTKEKVQPDLVVDLEASDGAHSTLRMWEPLREQLGRTPQDLLFIPGSAVSHLMVASPFLSENTIERFTRRGYRCWCLTTHLCMHEGNATKSPCTSYSARLDVVAGLEEIRRHHLESSVSYSTPYVIAHCAGFFALASALLDGTLPSSAIASVTFSQTSLTPCLSPLNSWKARLPLNALYRIACGDWFACDSPRHAGALQTMLDCILKFYPVGSSGEICSSTVCHRCSLVFGRLWTHRNLNEATHSHLHEVFGGIHADCMKHLADMCQKQTIADDRGRSLVTKQHLARLRGLPLHGISAADNAVYTPESTLKTWKLLAALSGEEVARRTVIQGIGHLDLWMGEKGAETGGLYDLVESDIVRVLGSC